MPVAMCAALRGSGECRPPCVGERAISAGGLFVDFDTAQFEESAGEAVADCLLVCNLSVPILWGVENWSPLVRPAENS